MKLKDKELIVKTLNAQILVLEEIEEQARTQKETLEMIKNNIWKLDNE